FKASRSDLEGTLGLALHDEQVPQPPQTSGEVLRPCRAGLRDNVFVPAATLGDVTAQQPDPAKGRAEAKAGRKVTDGFLVVSKRHGPAERSAEVVELGLGHFEGCRVHRLPHRLELLRRACVVRGVRAAGPLRFTGGPQLVAGVTADRLQKRDPGASVRTLLDGDPG